MKEAERKDAGRLRRVLADMRVAPDRSKLMPELFTTVGAVQRVNGPQGGDDRMVIEHVEVAKGDNGLLAAGRAAGVGEVEVPE